MQQEPGAFLLEDREPTTTEYADQLEQWVAGKSVHIGGPTQGSCTPDFSCCSGQEGFPLERRRFFRDNPKARDEMLFQALGQAFATLAPDKDIHITG